MEQRGTRAVVQVVQAVRIWYRYEVSDEGASGSKVGIPVAHGSMAYVGGSRLDRHRKKLEGFGTKVGARRKLESMESLKRGCDSMAVQVKTLEDQNFHWVRRQKGPKGQQLTGT